jgi:addiction module RelE/StbE family toxin
MARRIRWSPRAANDRIQILEYWIERNRSVTYSKKLNKMLNDAVQLISDRPEIGRQTNYLNVRIKIVRDYLIYYRIREDALEIITLWDGRRNPAILKKMLEE